MRGEAIEDIPVIIPVVLALVIFFGSLSWTVTRMGDVDAYVDVSVKLLEIADVFVQQGVITDAVFSSYCDVAKNSFPGYGFIVAVVSMNTDIEDALKCSTTLCCSTGTIPVRKRVLVRAFPVTYQMDVGGTPFNEVYKMVVATWREG